MVGITAIPASDSKLIIRTDTKPYSQTRKKSRKILITFGNQLLDIRCDQKQSENYIEKNLLTITCLNEFDAC